VSEIEVQSQLRQTPTFGELVREVMAMGAPIIASMSSYSIMSFVDFWMVSQVGRPETAAISPARITIFTMTAFLIGLARCTNTFSAQSYGRRVYRECGPYAWQGLYIALMAFALSWAVRPLAPVIFDLMGHEPELIALEVEYFQVAVLTIGFVTANITIAAFFQAIGRPKVPMVITFLANGLNVGLNYVLIFGALGFPAMGLRGAAVATVISTIVEGVLLLVVFLAPRVAREFGTRRWRWSWPRTKKLLRVGLPMGLSFMLDVACWTVFIGFVVGRFGPVQLAANNVADQIIHLSFLPALGMSHATAALVGQYIGRRDFHGARLRAYTALKLTACYMCLMGVVFFVFRRPLMLFFQDDPEVVLWGTRILILAAVFQIVDAFGIIMMGALRGAGDTRWPAVVTVSYAWFIMLPCSYLLGHVLGLQVVGAWLAATLYVTLYGVTMSWRFIRGHWEKIDIFGDGPPEAGLAVDGPAGSAAPEGP